MQQDETPNHGNLPQPSPESLGTVEALQERINTLAQGICKRRAFVAQLQAQHEGFIAQCHAQDAADQLAQNALAADLAEAIGGLVVNIHVLADGSMRSVACSRPAATRTRMARAQALALGGADQYLPEQHGQVGHPQHGHRGQ